MKTFEELITITPPKDSLYEAMVLYYKWCESGLCKIRSNDFKIIPLKLNTPQRIVLTAMLRQAQQNKPVRVVILKGRKYGISTLIETLFFFICIHYRNILALTLAHETLSTKKIFDIAKTCAMNYDFLESIQLERELRIEEMNSSYYCHTAGSEGIGAGSTPTLLHLSEVAYWPANKGEITEYTVTEAVPTHAFSLIAYESTAKGRNLFWQRFENARNPDSPYAPVFIPWYQYEGNAIQSHELMKTPDEELILISAKREQIDITDNQFAWRRHKINTLIAGEKTFHQLYPGSPEEAVSTAQGLVIPGIHNCVIDELPFDLDKIASHLLFGGIDFGYRDHTAIVSAVFWDDQLWIYKVYRVNNALAEDWAKGIESNHTYYCDPSALQSRKELASELNNRNISATLITALRKKDITRTSVDREYEVFADWVRKDRIRILESQSEQLIVEANNLAYDENTGRINDFRNEAVGHFDVLDATRYLVYSIDRKNKKDIIIEKFKSTPPRPYVDRRASLRRY